MRLYSVFVIVFTPLSYLHIYYNIIIIKTQYFL
nr:MAG TPA: hypothetical protein [Caudoviricetes sp.]